MTVASEAAKVRVGSTAYAWYVVTVLLLAQTCSFVDRMIMGLLVGPIRETFQISDTQYSLLAGLAFSIFYALMGFPLARIADRGSRRLLIGTGIAAWSFMTAVCGLAKGFWGLFLARVGVGVGEATLGPAAYSMITDYFPRGMLARALSVYMIGVPLGSGLAYMIGGGVVQWVQGIGSITLPVVGELYGWQPVFFIVGLPGILIALLMWTVREPLRRGKLMSASTQLPVREVVAYVLARRRAYGAHIIGIAVFVMVVYGLNLWGPTYLIRTFGYTAAAAGWTFGLIMGGAGTLGLLVAGWIADAWTARGRADAYVRIILASMIAMLPFVVALGFVTDVTLALAMLSVAIFLSAIQGGLAGGALQVMTPNQMRGQVMALYLFVANLIGLGLGPTVVAAITDYVFGRDDAIGQSLALTGAVLCPIAALILCSGVGAIRTELEAACTWVD